MAEKQESVAEASTLTAPPSLQVLETDAGLCMNGYCVLPQPPVAATRD